MATDDASRARVQAVIPAPARPAHADDDGERAATTVEVREGQGHASPSVSGRRPTGHRTALLWAGVAVAVTLLISGCGGSTLLEKAAEDVSAAHGISQDLSSRIGSGTSIVGDNAQIVAAQNLLDDARTKIGQAGQTSGTVQQAEAVTVDSNGVQSTLSAEQAAITEAQALEAHNESSFEARVTSYIFKTATQKVCQAIATALSGQGNTSSQYWSNQAYVAVEMDLSQSYSPQLVQEIAMLAANTVQTQVDRIAAVANADPSNLSSVLTAAQAYYNCLPTQ